VLACLYLAVIMDRKVSRQWRGHGDDAETDHVISYLISGITRKRAIKLWRQNDLPGTALLLQEDARSDLMR